MEKTNRFSEKIIFKDKTIQELDKKVLIKFNDPAGKSRARTDMPILYGIEGIRKELSDQLSRSIYSF